MSLGQRPRGSLQARLSETDPRLYNINRDLAHNMKDMLTRVYQRLEKRSWPELEQLLDTLGVPDTEVGKTFDCLCQYMKLQEDNMREEYMVLLDKAGWFKCHPAAQVAILAVLGTVVLGYHYAGVREATLGGVGPAASLQELADAGEKFSKLMTLPRWKRRFVVCGLRIGKALGVLTGRS